MSITIDRENICEYRTGYYPGIGEIVWEAGRLSARVLANFPNLYDLHCSCNRLKTLVAVRVCSQLRFIDCTNNKLVSLRGIEGCLLLERLECGGNRLTSLTGIDRCSRLQILNCENNQLADLNPLVYLRGLRVIDRSGNPLVVQTVQVERLLENIRPTASKSTIYSDRQNVHDTSIQRTVCDSIQRLLTDPKPNFTVECIIESELDEKAIRLILEYCEDKTVHSVHRLTYSELLAYVWARIVRSEHRSELIKILGEQVSDAECQCFTGRFNRTLSVLVGFYEDIIIEISDNSRIGAIITAIQKQLEAQAVIDDSKPYDPIEHRRLAHLQLIEAGYTEAKIKPWVEAIDTD